MKRYLLILATLLFFVFVPLAQASGFYLSAIGSMDVSETNYGHYWYKSSSPVLTGVAPAGATVNITVDSVTSSVTTNSSGSWAYQTNIGAGDHSILLQTQAATDYAFTLTIGELPDGVGSIESSASTPVAGVSTPTFLLLSLGLGFLVTPFVIRKFAFLDG